MRFRYEAIDKNKIKVSGFFEALDREQVIDYLLSQNMTVIAVTRKSNVILDSIKQIGALFKTTQLIEFTTEMRLLLSTGISAPEAVLLLSYANSGTSSYPFVSEIASNMARGVPMSLALSQFPSIFTSVYISLIESGERSNKLPQIFAILENQVKSTQESRKKIFTTLVYPLFLFLAMGLLMFFLSVFFLPSLVELYADLNIVLPTSTTLLINFARFLASTWQFLVMILLLVGIFIFQFYHSPYGRVKIDEFLLQVPIFAPILRATALEEIALTISILLEAKLDIERCLENASRAVSNRHFSKKLVEIRKKYTSNSSISKLFASYPIFPSIFIQMLSIGQSSNNFPEVMANIALYYRNQSDTALRSFTSVVQPLVISGAAIFIAILIFALFQPIYSIIGTLN